jgi:hypothetical protein
MGNVVTGKYHVGLSIWIWNSRRQVVGDFNVVFTSDYMSSSLVIGPSKIDTSFLIRPFTNLSWLCVLVLFSVKILILLVIHFIGKA